MQQTRPSPNMVLWETAGTIAGLIACACVAMQVIAEAHSSRPTSLSRGYVIGFLAIFVFWVAYGVRFSRPALWLTNGIATLFQAVLVVLVCMKS